MAHNPTMLGMQVHRDPAAAAKELRTLFGKLKTIDAVSKKLGVERHTIQRWIAKLATAGHSDPRVAAAEDAAAKPTKKAASKKK